MSSLHNGVMAIIGFGIVSIVAIDANYHGLSYAYTALAAGIWLIAMTVANFRD